MRFIIYGAGAVGSVIGGRIHEHAAGHGHEVVLVARAAHAAAIRTNGLVINDPVSTVVVDVPVVERIDEAEPRSGDVVIMSTKTQDTGAALDELAGCAPDVSVACAQNGVENERMALRRFANVYGICVILPASYMEPGVVDANGAPHNAILDIGRYPFGTDAMSEVVANTFDASGLVSESTPKVMDLKYAKLLMNLGNSVDALVADPENLTDVMRRARDEASRCFLASGITWTSEADDRRRRQGVMELRPIEGRRREGGSTWQSLARGATTTEVDWLNGEIVLLGRVHGVETPVNAMLCAITREAIARGAPPRSIKASELLARL